MNYPIAIIPGDGVGPDVVRQAVKVLVRIGRRYGFGFDFRELPAGGAAVEATGQALPESTVEIAGQCRAILLGAVGGPAWDSLPGAARPEQAILGLRKAFGLFANLRPALLFPQLAAACPLRPDIIGRGLDLLIVRELTGGIYFGERGVRETELGLAAYDVEQYSEGEVRRIAAVAFQTALKRRCQVTSVDKANVLESSRLWRRVVTETAASYPDVRLAHMYVDNAAMQLVRDPAQFDVIVTGNLFGDILSDEASMITGSIGMLPSASFGVSDFGLYEPIHGSAPDIAGTDRANPMATILAAAMMLRYSLNQAEAAQAIEEAVGRVLDRGYRTADLMSEGTTLMGTEKAGDLVAEEIDRHQGA